MAEERESFWGRFKRDLFFRVLWLISTGLAASVRVRVDGGEKLDRVVEEGRGGLVLPWHGTTLLPIYCFRGRGFYSIVSVSRDGELQNKLLRSRGFRTIRGSSGRRGMRALLESVRCLKGGGVMAFTPDGTPPPKKVQAGTIYLAQRSGCPVLPVGVACAPCKRLSSWDSFMLPAPFARAVISFGDSLHIAPDEDEDQAALRIESAINSADRRAEDILKAPRNWNN